MLVHTLAFTMASSVSVRGAARNVSLCERSTASRAPPPSTARSHPPRWTRSRCVGSLCSSRAPLTAFPTQVRLQFTSLASRLTSSVASVSKVASFALRHAIKCADDIWDCYLDEVSSATLNARVNLLFLLDSLLDKEGPRLGSARPPATHAGTHTSYRELVERDLDKVVKLVVPDSREGVLNWMSTAQVRLVRHGLCACSAHPSPPALRLDRADALLPPCRCSSRGRPAACSTPTSSTR